MLCYRYDKNNLQKDYSYMARNKLTRELVCGYVVIEKPWYEPESNWKYFIFYNSYRPGGFCGGAINEGIKTVEVDPKTIVPYTQVAEIIGDLETNDDAVKVEGLDMPGMLTMAIINSVDDMYKIYNRSDIDYVVGRLGEPPKKKEPFDIQNRNFKEYIGGIAEKQMVVKRNDLLAALTNFWNEWKSTYCKIIVGTGYPDDYEYIEEDNGKFTSSMLEKEYDSFDDIVSDFCKAINPDDVAGFDYAKAREK